MRKLKLADEVVMRLMPRRRSRGSTWFGRLGDVVQQPPVWAGVAAALALAGPRGRRAALRGSVHYGLTAVAVNLVLKPVMRRSRPPAAGKGTTGPVTTSFPSGHAATDLAFSLAASIELPVLFIPLSGATMAAHWSLVRSRGHYPIDVLAGGALAVALTLVLWKLWPPRQNGPEQAQTAAPAPASPAQGGRSAT